MRGVYSGSIRDRTGRESTKRDGQLQVLTVKLFAGRVKCHRTRCDGLKQVRQVNGIHEVTGSIRVSSTNSGNSLAKR
jgi:hypothetical protein